MAKVFYSNHNKLIDEWKDIIALNQNYVAIPDEIISLDDMFDYVKENKGSLFYPTSSIEDYVLKGDDADKIREAINGNI
jgi:hypothetical protein